MIIFRCDSCKAVVPNKGIARRRTVDLRSVDGTFFEIRTTPSSKYDLLCDDCWPPQIKKIVKYLTEGLSNG